MRLHGARMIAMLSLANDRHALTGKLLTGLPTHCARCLLSLSMRRGALTMVCAAEPTGPSHLLPKTARCRTTAFGAEPARCQACSGQEEARQISTHRFIAATCAVGAHRPPACDRHETGLFLSAPDAESWFSRAPTALHAPTETHQHTLHLRYTVSLYVHCRGSRGRAFSLSRTANTQHECAPCTST